MSHRLVVAVVVIAMAISLVPVGGVAAESLDQSVAGTPGVSADAPVTDRFRSGSSPAANRADTENLLEQPTRNAVYDAVRNAPGIALTELVEVVAVTKSTIRYHVDVLGDAGLVGTAVVAGSLRVAPAEVDAELAGVLHADANGTVLAAVAADEPASVTAIAEATDRAPSTVSHHLSTLEERGLVDRDRVGESVVTTLTPETRAAMENIETEAKASADD